MLLAVLDFSQNYAKIMLTTVQQFWKDARIQYVPFTSKNDKKDLLLFVTLSSIYYLTFLFFTSGVNTKLENVLQGGNCRHLGGHHLALTSNIWELETNLANLPDFWFLQISQSKLADNMLSTDQNMPDYASSATSSKIAKKCSFCQIVPKKESANTIAVKA